MRDLELDDQVRLRAVGREANPTHESHLPPSTSEWEAVQLWARAVVDAWRSAPPTDPWASWKVEDEERRQREEEK